MTSAIRKVGAAAIAATAGAAITIGGAQLASATSATATTGVNIRSGPGTSYSIIGGLTRGQSISIVGKATNGWSKVRFNGETAYVSAQYLDANHGTVAAASVMIYTKGSKITTAPLNVRSGPGLNNKVVGYLSSGQDVSLTGKQSKGFAEILYGGSRAWVSSQYLASSTTGLPHASGSRTATADLLIRTSTDSDFKIITTVKKGTHLQITGTTRNGYAQVVYGNAIRWVTAKYLSNAAVTGPTHASSNSNRSTGSTKSSTTTSSNKRTGNKKHSSHTKTSSTPSLPSVVGSRYATTELLVRTTSGSDYKTVATVNRGDTVKITGRTSNGRAQIVYGGSARWVTAQYLSTSKPMAASKSTSASAASVKTSHKKSNHKKSNHKKSNHKTSNHKTSNHKTSNHKTSNTSSSSGGLDPSYSGSTRNVSNSVWDQLAMCESSGNWSINTGNGFYGGLQFTLQTWHGFGGTGMPQNASRAEQIKVAERILAVQGWNAWPACSTKLGLR